MAISARRARVMQRSQRIGHCICDPRKPCPCDALIERDVCLCAGERIGQPSSASAIKLIQLVKSPGCASKVPPAELAAILAQLPVVTDERLLVGSATADDAGVFLLRPDLCLVQTVDVFTPCVDDPYTFGRIAACNSLSDVYAMGGQPITALSILSYPVHAMPEGAVEEMLRGGMDQLGEAGVALIGGHSIDDEQVKLGYAVTGVVDPAKVVTNAGAQPGDVVVLTKPIGTGVISFATQLGRASPKAQEAAARSMVTLNRAAAEAMVRHGAHAATDVTGFGLLAHLSHIARESEVTIEVWHDAVPLLPEALGYAQQGMVPGAAERNREYVSGMLSVNSDVPEHMLDLLCDPQTSGGLLVVLPAEMVDGYLAEARSGGSPESAVIGRCIRRGEGPALSVVEGRLAVTGSKNQCEANKESPRAQPSSAPPLAEVECCPHEGVSGVTTGTAEQAFQGFLAAAFRPGALDAVQKELTTIALSVAVQCEPCLKTHLTKAQSMGITPEEIEEAAWMGVVFGGCKAMMFWTGMRAGLRNKPVG